MKRIIYTAFFLLFLNVAYTQTISPSQNNEYCPGTEYTFVATITKSYSSMIGVGSAYVTQVPTNPVTTTFTFKGKFGDVNSKQAFRIYYTDNTFSDFEFKKIKSLFYNTCTPIQLSQYVINAPLCQIVNTPINFTNLQWNTVFESPMLCFGTINTYEYLLPSGWKLGTTTSNGSTWIAAGNNETITSDLTTGDGASIKVRPVNSACGAGLTAGQATSITISRPMTLSISGSQTICTGSSNYTVSGLPAGATVTWSTNSPSNATLTTNGNDATLTKVINGIVTLTATVTLSCGGTPFLVTKNISVGGAQFQSGTIYVNASNGPKTTQWGTWNVVEYGLSSSPIVVTMSNPNCTWTYYNGPVSTWSTSGYPNNSLYLIPNAYPFLTNTIMMNVSSTNECGQYISNVTYFQNYTAVNHRATYTTFPNPATHSFQIAINRKDGKILNVGEIEKIEILDKMSQLRYRKKFAKGTTHATVDVTILPSDVYTLRVFDGQIWSASKIIVQH